MRSGRISLVVLSCAAAVLVARERAAGQLPFSTSFESPDYAPGDLNGQGPGEAGWGGNAWVASLYYDVVNDGTAPDGAQHVRMFCYEGTQPANRDFPAIPNTQDFSVTFMVKLTPHAPGSAWQNPGEAMLREPTGNNRVVHWKFEPTGDFRMNEVWLNPWDGTDPAWAGASGRWCKVGFNVRWLTTTVEVYWEGRISGQLEHVADVTNWRDAGAWTSVDEIRLNGPKAIAGFPNEGIEWDAFVFSDTLIGPPPPPCATSVVVTSGAETVTATEGTDPSPIVYALINGGAGDHDYNVQEMEAVAPSITGLFNTGVDGSGAPLGDQVLDPHYTLTINPDSAGTGTYTSIADGSPIPPWIANNSTSRWITVRQFDDDSHGAPGQYVYRTTFAAPGSATRLYGRLAVDDSVDDILINGVSTGIDDDDQFRSWTHFVLDLGATDDTLDFLVTNGGSAATATGLRVELFDLAVTDIPWLSVSPGNPITVGGGSSAAVTAAIDTAGLPPGVYSAGLRFSNLDDCDPPNTVYEEPILRPIELTVTNWEVTPQEAQSRVFVGLGPQCPGQSPDDVLFTVTNVGLSTDLEYSVAKQDVCDWLTLDKSGSAGPIAPGNSDVVTGSIDGTGLGIGTYTCTLVFTNDVCTALPLERRTVTLSVLGTVWEYLGDVDPTDAGSAGLGLSFLVEEGVIQGAVEDDAQAVDGKVWRIQDTADAKTKFRSQPDTIIAGEVGATIVARVRVRSQSGGRELALGIWDLEPTYDTAEYFYSGDEGAGAGTVEEIRRGVSNPVTGDDQFHVLRLTVEGTSVDDRTIKLYFDEDPTPVVSITNAAGRTAGGTISDEGFAFGAGSTSGTMDIAFDCVAATNAGAFAPGAEPDCLGYRLCPLCPMPFADADQDGDVDHADFAAFQACYTGLNDPGSAYDAQKCHCFDRDNDQDVDEADLGEFEACATGADVLFDPEFPPEGCHP